MFKLTFFFYFLYCLLYTVHLYRTLTFDLKVMGNEQCTKYHQHLSTTFRLYRLHQISEGNLSFILVKLHKPRPSPYSSYKEHKHFDQTKPPNTIDPL